jgi:DNA-binding SARP family transcriptional activator
VVLRGGLERPPASVDWTGLTGELLPDWDDDWVLIEREHHRHLGLQALETLSERLLSSGRHGRALEVALAAVAKEPLRESAHRLLVRVHLADGNAVEALRQYRLFARLAYTRIGLAPSRQMEDLVRDLLPDDGALSSVA